MHRTRKNGRSEVWRPTVVGRAPFRAVGGFTLVETLVALAVVSIGFLGALATIQQTSKMVSAAEEDTLASCGIEQRIDQLRLLDWSQLTGTTGVTSNVWTARPVSMAGITVLQETITISAYDVAGAKTLQATWNGASAPTASFTGNGSDLSTASAVKVVTSITWTGRRSSRQQTRSGVTVISRGGISNSEL